MDAYRIFTGGDVTSYVDYHDGWDGGIDFYAVEITVDVKTYVALRNRGIIEDVCSQITAAFNDSMGNIRDSVRSVSLTPSATTIVDERKISEPSSYWKVGYYKVFISHVSKYKGSASNLKLMLEPYGISAFVAHEDIKPTKEWEVEIERALFSMNALCAILTPDFNKSSWCDQEVGYAFGRNILCIPIDKGQLPYGLFGKIQALKSEGKNAQQIAESVFNAYIAGYLDAMFNLHNLFGGYDKDRFWNAMAFLRAGLDSNLEQSSGSPLVGIGTEHTFKLNNHMKLFADLAYQFTSSEFRGKSEEIHSKHSGSNGWFDLNVGIQYEFGRNTWDKPGEKRVHGLGLTVQGSHNWPRFIVNTGASVVVAFGAKTVLKKAIKEERPDHSDNKSFPSGHASMAFAAARSIDKEFRKDCIWIPIAGYAAATAVGIERIANKHHHWYDVVAGAGIGIGSAELTWWLSDKLFGKGSNVAVGSSGNTVDVVLNL